MGLKNVMKLMSCLALVLVLAITVAVVIGYVVLLSSTVRNTSIKEISFNPESFDSVPVRLHGFVVTTHTYMFGPKYVLRDEGAEIALCGKDGAGIDFERCTSFVFDGENCTQIRDVRVSVEGQIHYTGSATDVPPYYLEVGKVELQTSRLDMLSLDSQQVRVEIDRTNYAVGEPVQFRVFTKNLNHQPKYVGVDKIGIDVFDLAGRSVFSMSMHLTWISEFAVDPGKEVELSGVLPPWSQTNSNRMQVPPGIYTIRLELDSMDETFLLWFRFAIAA